MNANMRHYRMQQWIDTIHKCVQESEARGITRRQWMEENNVSVKSYYRWMGIIQKEAANQLEIIPNNNVTSEDSVKKNFIELPVAKFDSGKAEEPPAKPTIFKIGNLTAEISNTAPPEVFDILKEIILHAI